MLETILQPDDTLERCGVLLDGEMIVEIDNVAEHPAEAYRMDPQQLLEQLETGRVTHMWHTHPESDPTLSGADHEGFRAWPDLVHCIVGRRDGKVAVTRYCVEDGLVLVCS